MGKTSSKQIPRAPNVPKDKKTGLLNVGQGKGEKLYKNTINFSFYFFDRSSPKYNLGGVGVEWFVSLLDRLKNLSQLKLEELYRPWAKETLRFHPVPWDLVRDDLNWNEELRLQLEQETLYQFSVSTAKGRILAFKVDSTFYVILLDPHHNTYPMDRHGGVKEFPPAKSEYELLLEELEECKKKYEELEQYLDILTKPSA